MNNKFPVL